MLRQSVMCRVVALAATMLALCCSSADALSIVGVPRVTPVSIPNEGSIYNAVSIDLVFDEPIKVRANVTGIATLDTPLLGFYDKTMQPSNQNNGGGDMPMPLLMEAGGFAHITCGNRHFETRGSMENGPPSFAIVSPPTNETVFSFVRQLAGDIPSQANDTWADNRLSLILIINGAGAGESFSTYANVEAFIACNPQLVFTGPYNVSTFPDLEVIPQIVDADGEPFQETVSLAAGYIPNAAPVCELAPFLRFADEFDAILTEMNGVDSERASKRVQWRLSALLTRRVFRGCMDTFNRFFNFVSTTIVQDNVRGCFAAADSAEYLADPCCNRALQTSMCCVPKNGVATTFMKIDSFRTESVDTCSSKPIVTSILQDLVESIRSRADGDVVAPQNDQSLYETKGAFQTTCDKAVFQSECITDQDCLYGNPPQCMSNGKCFVNHMEQTEFLMPCYVQKMDADIRARILRRHAIPVYTDPVAQEQSFIDALGNSILSNNCVGPKSQAFSAHWDPETQSEVPADLTGCVQEQGCNWNPQNNPTAAQCVGADVLAVRGTHFCGQDQGTSFWDVSQPSRCQILPTAGDNWWGMSPQQRNTTCSQQYGGTYVVLNEWMQECLNMTARTLAACEPNNSTSCEYLQSHWHLFKRPDNTDVNDQRPVMPATCRRFHAGVYDTADACAVGQCNVPNLRNSNGQHVTAEQCAARSVCNIPCGTEEQPWAPCESDAACLAAGKCNDDEFGWCGRGADGTPECVSAACVEPWVYDEWGNTMGCQMTEEAMAMNRNIWSTLGCIHWEHTNATTCAAAGMQWVAKATTPEECSAHGQGCTEPFRRNHTPKDLTECSLCGGTYGDLYKWIPGRLSASRMRELERQPRAFGSVNAVALTVDHTKIRELVNDAVSDIRIKTTQQQVIRDYGRPIRAMKPLVCMCLTDPAELPSPDYCLQFITTRFLDAQYTQDPNALNAIGGLTFQSVVADGETVVAIDMYRSPAGAFAAMAALDDSTIAAAAVDDDLPARRRRRLLFLGPTPVNGVADAPRDEATTEIVRNGNGYIVGQLAGDGITFTGVPTVNATAAQLCLNISVNLPLMNSRFTEPDFVTNTPDSNFTVSVPMDLNITVEGLQYCATVVLPNVTTTFFPILRVLSWATVNSTLDGTRLNGVAVVASTSSSRDWLVLGLVIGIPGAFAVMGALYWYCIHHPRAKGYTQQ